MNEVAGNKPFTWPSQQASDPFQVKSEFVTDDHLFGVDKAQSTFNKSKLVPTATVDAATASLQTAFCRRPSQKSVPEAMFTGRDDVIKAEMNENNFNTFGNVFTSHQEQSTPIHTQYNSQPMFCNNNAAGNDQQMDIYRELILRHLIQDISTTCAKLGLPTDPYNWTVEHGSRWIKDVCLQFSLPAPQQTMLTGRNLLAMTQKEFLALAPEAGDTLFAQLQLWKTAFESYQSQQCAGQGGPMTANDTGMARTSWMENEPMACDSNKACNEFATSFNNGNGEMHNMNYYNNGSFTPVPNDHNAFFNNDVMLSPSNSDISSNSSVQDANEDDLEMQLIHLQRQNGIPFSGTSMMTPGMSDGRRSPFPRHSGTVHLWHFIREVLDHPKQYGSCVRWVDREEGTFKIESSHHLARYWGQRKNRTQMNYDKLSRSLRQYYKKGIIQKPEKKQRLVYKFLPPYNL